MNCKISISEVRTVMKMKVWLKTWVMWATDTARCTVQQTAGRCSGLVRLSHTLTWAFSSLWTFRLEDMAWNKCQKLLRCPAKCKPFLCCSTHKVPRPHFTDVISKRQANAACNGCVCFLKPGRGAWTLCLQDDQEYGIPALPDEPVHNTQRTFYRRPYNMIYLYLCVSFLLQH